MAERLAWRNKDISFHGEDDFPLRVRLLRFMGRQTWIAKGHDRLLRLIWHPGRRVSFGFEIDFYGMRYRGDLAHYIDWLVFCYGGAPVSELTLLKRAVAIIRQKYGKSAVSFFDVGGNAGHHAMFMSTQVDHVFVFEPFPELCSVIRERMQLNAIGNLRLFGTALGAEDGEVAYYPGLTDNSGTGTLLPDAEERQATPVTVPVRNGDALLAREGLPPIDILKVDVEGYEPLVFRGLTARLQRDRPIVLTELSDESRRGFGAEAAFRDSFYPGAAFFEVGGRNGRPFTLKRFDFHHSQEVLVVPPELRDDFQRSAGGAYLPKRDGAASQSARSSTT